METRTLMTESTRKFIDQRIFVAMTTAQLIASFAVFMSCDFSQKSKAVFEFPTRLCNLFDRQVTFLRIFLKII